MKMVTITPINDDELVEGDEEILVRSLGIR